MRTEVFLDTAYAIALSSANDQFHQRAVLLFDQLEREKTRIVTTRAILIEIGNALSKQRYRQEAVKLLDALEADPHVEVIPLMNRSRPTEELAHRSVQPERPHPVRVAIDGGDNRMDQ